MTINLPAVKAIRKTFIKVVPTANIDDLTLAQYRDFPKDHVLELEDYEDMPGNEHYYIILREPPEGSSRRNWYVYKPDVEILT